MLVLASIYFWPLLCTDSICFTLIQLYWLTGCNKSSYFTFCVMYNHSLSFDGVLDIEGCLGAENTVII